MALNGKNEETGRPESERAGPTDEMMAGAITPTPRERLAREECRHDLDAAVEELLAIGRRCAKSLQPDPAAVEHGDLLYDEDGLPR
ncbi:MAG: type II toxin-antitoxin system VapB family antitoxin [Acidobacteria bacterium]|nr:type II toxin-antitoxin system VapB family antitoxin [Acidobacteriota bacterium]